MRPSKTAVGIIVAFALIAPACGGSDTDPVGSDPVAAPTPSADVPDSTGDVPASTADDDQPPPPLISDGVISEAALDAVLTADGEVDADVLAAYAAEFATLSDDQQLAVAADLSRRTELELAKVSGLEAAGDDPAATEAALSAASAQILEQTNAAADAVSTADQASTAEEPQGLRAATAAAAAAPGGDGAGVAATGLFLGFVALQLAIGTIADASNKFEAGDSDVYESNGLVAGASVDEVNVEITYTGKQDGVDVDFTTGAAIQPCPNPDGSFTIDAVIDVKASKNGAGQNARMQLKIDGTVDDNAELADKNIENNVQWSDFAGGKGQFVDFTMSGPNGAENFVGNRTGGNVTDSFYKYAATLAVLIGLLTATKLLETAEKAWKSGRCVKLNVTPSAGPDGLSPSEVVNVLAEPRSKVDGQPTGGNVTATLSAGGASVEPNGSPVPADADSTYTAPDEQDKTGTVAYESRSRRGVGKAELTFSTTKPAAYQVVGGLEDWQVDQVVCDVTKPFTLTSPGIGTAEFSGGLTGTYSATGIFDFSYAGTYQITLSEGLGSPGSMIATSSGTIAEQAGAGSENYVLTPTTC